MEKYYYHITAPENAKSILRDGLKANEDGDIFLFENKSIAYPTAVKVKDDFRLCDMFTTVADHIARNQVFLERYAMLEISADGIEGELVNDDVAEFAARFQWIAKQPVISPEHITPFGILKARKPKVKKIYEKVQIGFENEGK